ncbi:MAG TPA: radical SAM protein [Clostridiaceae bacterium]
MDDLFSLLDLLEHCNLCPRNCNVDRLHGELGFCNSTREVKIARAALHFYEEPCISGKNGSGTVFFSGCNLKCVFCQNSKLSQSNYGAIITEEELCNVFLKLQYNGASNINLVTPSHYVPQIIIALKLSKAKGLKIPIVYNTSGYEKAETIKLLDGIIDIYLTDFKYYNSKFSTKYSAAKDYSIRAKEAIEEMVCQVGETKLNKVGMMEKGVIIRHLMLPGLLFDSKKIIDYIYNKYKDKVYISIMNQYTPFYKSSHYPELNKSLNQDHYEALVDYSIALGITKGFIQEVGTDKESFIPDFDLTGIK